MLYLGMLKEKDILRELTILYIEDKKIILDNVSSVLKLFAKKVITSDNASDAFDLYESQSIDIIISDIELKDSSGIELIKKIRTLDKKIPIIIVSGYTDTKYLLEAIKLNIIEYIVKPLYLHVLKKVLYSAVKYIVENNLFEIKFQNNICYNVKNNQLLNCNRMSQFTSTEIKLLEFLIKNKKDYVSTESINYHLYDDKILSASALKTLISKIRKKIGKDSIINLSGIGYKINLKD